MVYEKILSWTPNINQKPEYLLKPRTVQELFQNSRLLVIPDYQRPYSWTKKNIEDLLNDVLNLSKSIHQEGKSSSWFFGPIFSVRKTESDDVVELLDGQQRITTLQILLRELSLCLYLENPIDFSQNKDLEKKLNRALDSCTECLIRRQGLRDLPKFQTEESVKEFFKDYILEFNDIESFKDLEKKRKTFKRRADEEKRKGSKTAGNIYEASVIIKSFILRNFISHELFQIEKLHSLYNYIETLLTECWLIEIPLQNHEDSIQIFESINNRGKQLTLVDKLRYKTLISASEKNLSKIRADWKDIYSGLDFLLEKNFIKAEDDFFKVFFLSVNGDNLTKEDEHLAVFQDHFLSSDNDIQNFLLQSQRIVDFYKYLNDPLAEDNLFIKSFKPQERDKIKALLRLFRKALKISANSRMLLFYLIRAFEDISENNYSIVNGIWNIIRIVFKNEIVDDSKSNKVRTDYLDLIKSYEKKEKNILDASEISNYKLKFKNIIKNADNDEAQFIIYLYSYLNDHTSLTCHTTEMYQNSQLDHLFPTAWKKHWDKQQYKVEEVVDFIEELGKTKPELFEFIKPEQLINEIKSVDKSEFELKEYTYSKYKQPDSIIEYIGNKWVLSGSKNAASGNSSFKDKITHYQHDKYVKVPVNDNKQCGMDIYIYNGSFTFKEIIPRSLVIVNGIIKNYSNTWSSV